MLKHASLHPPIPKRAKTRPFPSFVLVKVLNVFEGKSRSWRTQGWAGWNVGTPPALTCPAALLDNLFEHPADNMVKEIRAEVIV